MKKLIFVLLILCVASFAFASIEAYQSAKKDFQYIEHSDKVTIKSYKIVADKFYGIYANDPNGKLADDALHYTAQTYYRGYVRYQQRSDLLNAIKYLKLLASNYSTRLASLAYLQASKLYEEQKDFPSARYMLKKLITRFPNTEDSKTAEMRLTLIDKKFEKSLYADPVEDVVDSDPSDIKDDGAFEIVEAPKDAVPVVPAVAADSNAAAADETADSADASSNGSKEVAYGDADKDIAVPAGKVAVKRVRYFSTEDYTRVVLDLTGKADFEKHWLKANPEFNKPPRLFLDIENAVMSREIPKDINIKDGLLRSLRWGYNRPGVARVVLDSDTVKDFTVFAMTDPHRIVIDVSGTPMSKKPAADTNNNYVSSTKTVPTGTKVDTTASTGNTLASIFGLKINTIVIDPGHGGKDPGAKYYGLEEKDIVLDVGKELYRMIKSKYKDIEVYMTRNRDVFIPLEARTAFANRKKADIFISIHVNAAPNKRARGVETYVLNVTNDKNALEVAAFENATTQKSMSDLQGILKDIMLNSKLEESLQLASFVQKSLHGNIYKSQTYNLGVKQAPFYVLVGAKMPAVLIEAGFVSNSSEAKLLKTTNHRREIAKGIFSGLVSYLKIFNGD